MESVRDFHRNVISSFFVGAYSTIISFSELIFFAALNTPNCVFPDATMLLSIHATYCPAYLWGMVSMLILLHLIYLNVLNIICFFSHQFTCYLRCQINRCVVYVLLWAYFADV